MSKFVSVICKNDYPEAAYEDADIAERKRKALQEKADKKMEKEGGMIYYHIKIIPYIGGE